MKRTTQDEFGRAQDYIKANYGLKYEFATNYDDNYLVSYSTSNRAIFLQLIGTKGILGKSILNTHQKEIPPINFFEKNPILISDNNRKANHNLPNYFKGFNKILTDTFRVRLSQHTASFIPDYNYCKKLLNSIEEEFENTKNDDFLDEY